MLIYDGGCGFCRRSLGWARRLGATCDMQPAGALDLAAYGLTPADAQEAAWYVGPDGRLSRGHEAIARTLESSRYGVVRLAGRVAGSRLLAPVARRVYAWVADHRHLLPGGPDAGVCGLDARDGHPVSGSGSRAVPADAAGGSGAGGRGSGAAPAEPARRSDATGPSGSA